MSHRYALVTGAASGIGAEFCRQLAERGWTPLMVDRNPCPSGAVSLKIDLAVADAPERVMQWLDELGVTPELLVNNAGIFDFRRMDSMTPSRLNLYIDLHMRSVTHLCMLMIPAMEKRGGGMILNMSSLSCWTPMPGIAMYSATKAYIRCFSRALRLEAATRGVSVTVACPGGIATDLFGLPRNLQRLGVRVGALYSPKRFVKGALRATFRHRKQYVNGLFNKAIIPLAASTPDWLRKIIVRYIK